MKESPLQRLIELVKFDQQVLVLERSAHALTTEAAQLENEINQLQLSLEAVKQHKRDTRKAVDEKELHMKELDQQEREAKKLLDKISTQREYESLTKQMKTLQKNQHDFEEELLESWKQYELAQKQFDEKKEHVANKLSQMYEHIKEKKEKVAELTAQIDQLNKSRPAKEHLIPEELIEKYQMMRKQVSNPVVPIEHASCSACFYHLSKQDLITIERGALQQCRNCFRFLYHDIQQ